MNAITLNLADHGIQDAADLATLSDAKLAGLFAAWRIADGEHAKKFRDYALQDWMVNDQVGRAFLTPQLLRIEAEVYTVKRPSFDFRQFMTVVEDGDMWDVGTVFYSMDGVGRAEFMSGKGFDMPYAANDYQQFTHGYHLAALGYEWTVQELERAAKLGRSLSSDKAMAVDQGVQSFLYSIAMTGRTPGAATSEKNWTGLVNNGSANTALVAADGTGATRPWANKTPDQILRDINEAITSVEQATGETHIANTLLLPTSAYNAAATTRLAGDGVTLLTFLQANNTAGEALTIRKSRALETAGAGATRRMIAYDNSREVIRFHLPGAHTFLPAYQKSSMTWEVGGIMNVGGVEVRLPKAISYRDGF